jgi:hypothetical protein
MSRQSWLFENTNCLKLDFNQESPWTALGSEMPITWHFLYIMLGLHAGQEQKQS